jgi:hypothetical protein
MVTTNPEKQSLSPLQKRQCITHSQLNEASLARTRPCYHKARHFKRFAMPWKNFGTLALP